jgi:hypothetical protein
VSRAVNSGEIYLVNAGSRRLGLVTASAQELGEKGAKIGAILVDSVGE